MTDLFAFADAQRQNWRANNPPTSKAAGLSAHKFQTDHHNAILTVLRRACVPLAPEQISDAICLGHANGKFAVCLDTVQVCKRIAELIEAGQIERTAQTHVNRSGRAAFRVQIKSSGAGATVSAD